jgi:hypothetical protein
MRRLRTIPPRVLGARRHPAGEGPARWRPCSRGGGEQRVGAVGHRLEPRGVVLEDCVERLPFGLASRTRAVRRTGAKTWES